MDVNSGGEKITLSRDLSLFTITMIGVGGMIGAGIFVLTGIAAGVAGPALILAFLLNGAITLLTASAYAELGSAYPEAGGGYLWVKEALGGANGFLAGWMSWFAHAVAGSLYALAFGRFFAELWNTFGGLPLGLTVGEMSLGMTAVVILVFTSVNYRGASETGTVGNIVTLTKVSILGLFVFFGVIAMAHTVAWHTRFTTGFMPNGVGGVVQAMGLTFIAFEGYEIIAQSGEEVVNPKRNIPRAIFFAILIAVVIYMLVGTTAIGAIITPAGVPAYQYLGERKEIAIVDVAKQVFPFGVGGVVLLISGLVSTMSALNATTYSSSRVSFAMGRDRNLPGFFARIHPIRHTPHMAVIASGCLMLVMAMALPLEDVAASADIMFLLLFAQVNIAVMTLRHKRPDIDRGFRVPWQPFVPVLALFANVALAIYLVSFSPEAWAAALIWIVLGLLAHYAYFSRIEAMEKPKEILHEEVLVSREYSVLVPVANMEQARMLGFIGSVLAEAAGGEVLALHVIQVPPQLTLGEGRHLLKEGRPFLDEVIRQARQREVAVHTILRLGRNVAEAVRKTAIENASDLIVLGWPGYTDTSGKLFGSVTDPIVDNPPADVVVVRYRKQRALRSLLVPVGGGPNSRRAAKIAVAMARGEAKPAKVVVAHVVPVGAREEDRIRGKQAIDYALEGIDYPNIEIEFLEGNNIADPILEAALKHDLVVLGATEEPLFKNFLVGPLPERIARRSTVTVMMVKRRSSPLHSFVRQTLLEPTKLKPLD
jgi:amino acid transporter/nucleotide-binding universal stress UspA family protein